MSFSVAKEADNLKDGRMLKPRQAYIALNLMEGIGPVKVRALIKALGSVEAVFEAGEADLLQAEGIGPALAGKMVDQIPTLDPDAEEAKADKLGAEIITQLDDDYPELLKKIHDPPLALYGAGRSARPMRNDPGGIQQNTMPRALIHSSPGAGLSGGMIAVEMLRVRLGLSTRLRSLGNV